MRPDASTAPTRAHPAPASRRSEPGRPHLPGFLAMVAAGAVALAPAEAAAQVAGVLPASNYLPASTRAMALGDSYAMDSGHADAIFYHPALLTEAAGFGVDVQRWGPAGSAAAASGAAQWLGGGVGIGLSTLQYSTTSAASASLLSSQDRLFEVGPESVSERTATVAYARRGPFGLDVGLAVSLVDERVGSTSHGVTLFDVGVARDVGPLTVGLTAHDIGEKPVLDSGTEPARIELGAGGYGQPVGILDLGYAAHVALDDEEVTFGGGLEVGYWPVSGRTFVARVGFQHVPDGSDIAPITTGFAFQGDDITVEWAFRPLSGADEGGTHRFGVRWR